MIKTKIFLIAVLGLWIQASQAQNTYYSNGHLAYVKAAEIAYFENGSLAYSGAARVAYHSNGTLAYVGNTGKAYYSSGQLAYCEINNVLLDKNGGAIILNNCPTASSSDSDETFIRLKECTNLYIRIKDNELKFVLFISGRVIPLE
ncbi:hypothetical protein BKI52_20435 [marine bacterium AO1-C]|nr:hypothetical protein BKI52_20435 [marine bacterium AO1-C]